MGIFMLFTKYRMEKGEISNCNGCSGLPYNMNIQDFFEYI